MANGSRKTRRLGRGLSSLVQLDQPVEVTSREQTKSDNSSGGHDPTKNPSKTDQDSVGLGGSVGSADGAGASPEQGDLARMGSAVSGRSELGRDRSIQPDSRPGAGGPRPQDEAGGGTAVGGGVETGDQPRPGFPAGDAESPTGGEAGGLRRIPVDRVVPSPFQPRTESGSGSLAQLAESIKQSGVIQPIVVRMVDGGGGAATYELVAGERRWRASRLAGMSVIPAVVRELSDEQAAEWALVENIQREDLNPMERGRALAALVSRFGLTQEEVGRKVAMERSSVTNLIRLTELEAEIQELLSKGAIGMGHGKALLGVQPGAKRVSLAQRAARDGWTVRMLETHAREARPAEELNADGVRSGNGKAPSGDSAGDERRVALDDLEKQIGDALGTKVRISTDKTGTRGSMTIRFYGLEHFDGLVSKMGVELK